MLGSTTMRSIAIILGLVLVAPACTKSEQAGIDEAQKAADKEHQDKMASTGGAAKKQIPPVPGRAKLSWASVIDTDKFKQILGEVEPLTGAESKSEPDAAGSCSILRGGKRPDVTEQAAITRN